MDFDMMIMYLFIAAIIGGIAYYVKTVTEVTTSLNLHIGFALHPFARFTGTGEEPPETKKQEGAEESKRRKLPSWRIIK